MGGDTLEECERCKNLRQVLWLNQQDHESQMIAAKRSFEADVQKWKSKYRVIRTHLNKINYHLNYTPPLDTDDSRESHDWSGRYSK